jgi:hypothetical protein
VDRAVARRTGLFSRPEWAGMTATARGKLLCGWPIWCRPPPRGWRRWRPATPARSSAKPAAQIAYVAEYYRYYAGLADKIEGAHLPIDKPDMEVWLRREPSAWWPPSCPGTASCSCRRSSSARRWRPAARWC